MIDHPRKTECLSHVTECLPIEANITQYLAGELMANQLTLPFPKSAMSLKSSILVTWEAFFADLDIGGAETGRRMWFQ